MAGELTGWQPMTTAPENATRVLLATDYGVVIGFFCTDKREWLADTGHILGGDFPANAWQPLPEKVIPPVRPFDVTDPRCWW